MLQVHLHERCGQVVVQSGGGDVECWISPSASVVLRVRAAGGMSVDPALKVISGHSCIISVQDSGLLYGGGRHAPNTM